MTRENEPQWEPAMQAQCWICPLCYDDKRHAPGDEHCLRAQVSGLSVVRKDLDGQVLALRAALTEINKGGGVCREDEGHCIHCIAEKALTDTAQAGRDAESRVLDNAISELAYLIRQVDVAELSGLVLATDTLEIKANRLRKGGSDHDL